MLLSLALPILLSAVALFFASFLSWMVLQLHKPDWVKVPHEDDFMAAAGKHEIPVGNYMFPHCASPEEMKSEAFQKRYDAGPRGTMTILPKTNMGQNLGLTFVYFLVVSFCLAYLATIGIAASSDFLAVFRFVATAGLLTFLAAIVPHAIWFRVRIVGHVVEAVVYAAIVGGIFAVMWPAT